MPIRGEGSLSWKVATVRGVISDEVYEKFIYDGMEHASPASFSAEAYDHVITINAASKTYSMTGWRIGYAAGPKSVIEAAYFQAFKDKVAGAKKGKKK